MTALAFVACSQPEPGDTQAASERRNIVLIVCDTLRADWTSPYGAPDDITPEIARWAKRGVVFERVRSQSSWTKISMASMMTSLWPRSLGIRGSQDGLGDGADTLAEILSEHGWATYAVQTNGWLHQSFGFHQGFDRYTFPRGGGAGRFEQPSVWPHADRVVEEAYHLIEAHDSSRPFFLYLHFMDVHEYAAPPEFRTFGTDGRGAYRSAIRWVDHAVERVRKKLAAEGYLKNTIMIFTADHGETFGEHGIHGHARNVLTPVVWVPLVMRLPSAAPPVRVSSQVRNLDLAPTILEFVGIDRPESFEGESSLALLDGGATALDRTSFAGLGLPLFRDASVQSSMTTGVWTFARNEEAPVDQAKTRLKGIDPGKEFLFDRSVDPGENVNLIQLEPTHASRMRAAFDSYLEGEVRAGVLSTDVRIDPSVAERLRQLGYLE